ncbi:hypothetical protein KP509_16G001700 [Ceratopteris richardii]|uniref:Protein kinase domain-containing protein n=1 Tax=Ceratopteris richardii TaxID=49495 RepID=A0A8T2SWA8_CERRI|nr:hypothetical protein KP509_16G001700 [Ceratopteris richardii]
MQTAALLTIILFLVGGAFAVTDPDDVTVLQTLYTYLQSPSSLTSWSSNSGDPCGQSWKGVTCAGSAVTELKLPSLGLTGQLSYNLGMLKSLHVLDLSNNQLSGQLPYPLPPNLKTLNLGNNKFSENLPYSLSALTGLVYLYMDRNSLTGSLADVFPKLGNLSVLDLSFNKISGYLPQSFSSLYNLSSLYLQNNNFTGDLNVLANLKLQDLNVENNDFTGWLPKSFSSIPDLRVGGNSFSSSPAPPPPPFTPPPPVPVSSRQRPSPSSRSGNSGSSSKSINGGVIGGIVVGAVLAIILSGAVFVFVRRKARPSGDEKKFHSSNPISGTDIPEEQELKGNHELMASLLPTETVLKPPPAEKTREPILEKVLGRKVSGRRGKNTISATAISVADLQIATDSFSHENFLATTILGPIYKGQLPNGKLLAIRKIDLSAAPSVDREEDFMEVVSNISCLRHPNLAEMIGYCAEHGQRLLVYDYFQRGSLSDILHILDESFRSELTWNIRVKIALGTARALEYLHEECQPAVIHRDFKSDNILLDEDFNPHLFDSGIATLVSNPDLQMSSTVFPTGYSAPECTMMGVYTWQSDVYSFGVVMLELLTGRKPMDSTRPRAEQSLVRWATPQLHDIDALSNMVDPCLNNMYPAKSLSRFADIISQCIQPEMEFRPPMSEVVQSLVRLMQRASLNKRKPGDDQENAK